MSIYSWQLTLITIVAFLPVIPILRFLQRRQLVAYDKVRTCTGDMLAEFSETITGAAAVRAYGLEERSRDRLHERVHQLYLAHREAGRYFALDVPASATCSARSRSRRSSRSPRSRASSSASTSARWSRSCS